MSVVLIRQFVFARIDGLSTRAGPSVWDSNWDWVGVGVGVGVAANQRALLIIHLFIVSSKFISPPSISAAYHCLLVNTASPDSASASNYSE